MTDPTDFALDALAVFRLTKLVNDDTIADRPRDFVHGWLAAHDHPKAVVLLECPWCAGFWISAGCYLVKCRWPRAWNVIRYPLALSAAAGLTSTAVAAA